ncbi:sugar transferase EpsL [Planomicrobium koreense]|uniref:Sugar transferase EpsL n=1 Tax=Planococcus koreensis TaxID=112331 RepID=A0A7W8FSP7_9BACL|nr:sugar transferase [Planococcus koreensis]MBB5179246.1 sugar transferase EpsL [Planococcus koreensis]
MTLGTVDPVKRKNKVTGSIKRAFEFIAALLMLVMLSPLFLVIAILVKSESKGPVFFTQMRGGKDNVHFLIYKFRTMADDDSLRDDTIHVLETDSRITKVGYYLRKMSLDELPQLINIVKGDMSFVGPRPTLTSQTDSYTPYQMQRLLVKPGVTGWAQVRGRNSLSWNEKIELDLEYIERQSLRFDFYILLQTVQKVFNSEGVFRDESKQTEVKKKNQDARDN